MAETTYPEMNRIFVVGCPRSGTTLVQALLSLVPRILCFTETQAFASLSPAPVNGTVPQRIGDPPPYRNLFRHLTAGVRARRRLKRAARRMELPGSAEAAIRRIPALPAPRQSIISGILKAMDRAAAESGKRIWAEKTPWHLHYLSEISAIDPEARAIHVVRNGADVVASGYDLLTRYGGWGTPRNREEQLRCVDAAIERWTQDIRATLRWLGTPNHMVLRYETLLEQPEAALAEVGRFLGIDIGPALPIDLSRSPGYLAQGPWNTVSSRVSAVTHSKFETLFDPELQRYVLQKTSDVDGLDRLPGPPLRSAG
jgi:hypothetical protein